MVRTFQLTKSLARLRVIENMKLGATDQRGEGFFASLARPLWRSQEKEIEERADELLVRFKLDHMRDEFAGELSGGQRKLLEMARALMVRPQLVMLDEPMAGVNPALTQSLLGHVKALRDEGMTVDVRRARHGRRARHQRLGDRHGRGSRSSPRARADDISTNPQVIDAYLGAHHDAPTSRARGGAAARRGRAAIAEQEGLAADAPVAEEDGEDA